jgi:hypothetical protein
MSGTAWLLMTATLGVDFGWQVAADGKLEYIVQIPRTQYESLPESAEGLVSNLPPEVLPHLRRLRIVVGQQPLPRDPLPNTTGVLVPRGDQFNDNMNAQAVGLQAGGETGVPFASGAPESSVQPLDRSDALPGPSYDPGQDVRPLLELPNMRGGTGNFANDVRPTRDPPIGASIPYQRQPARGDTGVYPPQTAAPGFANPAGPGPSSFGQPYHPNLEPSYPARAPSTTWPDSTASFNPPPTAQIPYVSPTLRSDLVVRSPVVDLPTAPTLTVTGVLMLIIGLCMSLGANLYLGWLAWEYYLRYRESFETWRNSAR